MGRPRTFDIDEVIDAACVVFAARPYAGVSVDDLVRALGVHRNSLYLTFGSKRGLYLRVLQRYHARVIAALCTRVASVPTLSDAVEELLASSAALDLLIMASAEHRAPATTDPGTTTAAHGHPFVGHAREDGPTAGSGVVADLLAAITASLTASLAMHITAPATGASAACAPALLLRSVLGLRLVQPAPYQPDERRAVADALTQPWAPTPAPNPC